MTTTDISHRGTPKGSDPLSRSIRNAIKAAARQDRPMFLSAAYGRYVVSGDEPSTSARYYRFDTDGSMWMVEA